MFDSWCSFWGGEVSGGGVEPATVVPAFDLGDDEAPSRGVGGEPVPVDQPPFPGGEEHSGHGPHKRSST